MYRHALLAMLLLFVVQATPVEGQAWEYWKDNRDQFRRPTPIPEEALYNSVNQSFGSLRGSYFVENRLVSEQVHMGLSVPDVPSPFARLPDGNFIESGCRHRSCFLKAAVIATPEGKMLAAGLIHPPCAFDELETPKINECTKLTMFIVAGTERTVLVKHLIRWAKDKSQLPIMTVETITLR